jgi:hypothetical protein
MNKDTSGPAFPINANESADRCIYTGMTLRDYMATKAMQSLMQNFLANDLDLKDPMGWMDGLAGDAYLMADAMLKAREQ